MLSGRDKGRGRTLLISRRIETPGRTSGVAVEGTRQALRHRCLSSGVIAKLSVLVRLFN